MAHYFTYFEEENCETDYIKPHIINAAVVLVDDANENNIFVISSYLWADIEDEQLQIVYVKLNGFTEKKDGI